MKLTTQQISEGEDEIILRYRELTPEISALIKQIKQETMTILGKAEDRQYRVKPSHIYYFESVDERLFAYTREQTFQVMMTLAEVEVQFSALGFFRCNKSTVLNVNRVASVKSEMGNRINATLDNGEHVMISRHYARAFRELLRRGGSKDA